MSGPPHILVAISGHGLGHLSQASAVINALTLLTPECHFTIRSPLATATLRQWIIADFVHHQVEDDIGMRMSNALDVDIGASEVAYAHLHNAWAERVSDLAFQMLEEDVTLVLCDIAYLPLAAAQSARIPNVALCSLNWADVMARYLDSERVNQWLVDIRKAYQQANLFILPTPSMAMPWLDNYLEVAPIGRVGRSHWHRVAAYLEAGENAYIVLVGMGGMALRLDPHNWPTAINGHAVHYIVPDSLLAEMATPSELFYPLSGLKLPYHHVMASVDLMLTKPGYGTFVEAAATGLPVIYVARDDWPDSQSLVGWLSSNGLVREITRDAIEEGAFIQEMEALLTQGRYSPISPDGAVQAADAIISLLNNVERR
ncbi:hypothetical protein ACU6TU_12010 [Halomonas sp. LS-001]